MIPAEILATENVEGNGMFRICKKFEYQLDRAVARNRRESPVAALNRKLSHLVMDVLCIAGGTY